MRNVCDTPQLKTVNLSQFMLFFFFDMMRPLKLDFSKRGSSVLWYRINLETNFFETGHSGFHSTETAVMQVPTRDGRPRLVFTQEINHGYYTRKTRQFVALNASRRDLPDRSDLKARANRQANRFSRSANNIVMIKEYSK